MKKKSKTLADLSVEIEEALKKYRAAPKQYVKLAEARRGKRGAKC
jgi:hypothetical protein